MAIKYQQSKTSNRPTFRTERFGNLMADTISGEVDQSSDGTWNGWLVNWSNRGEFKLGFGSRSAAVRWVNRKLRERGIDNV